ncbi:MAG: c-type cytochrome [Candidatus Rokuibacteriota bacterium]
MKLALLAGVLVASTAVVVGCAATKSMLGMGDPIAERQQLMKDQGAAMKSMQDKVKAGQHQAIGPEAQKLVDTAKRIPGLFPQGSLDPKTSRAKPEIWPKWSEFQANAKTLETKATNLAAMSRTGTAEATAAAIGDLGKTTCTHCHNSFRGPEIKK